MKKLFLNKKGMHLLNSTELVLTFTMIGMAILLLFLSGQLLLKATPHEVNSLEQTYLGTQTLRTFSQSAVTVHGESMTVATALNEYFKYDSSGTFDSVEFQYYYAYFLACQSLAEDFFKDVLGGEMMILAHLYKGNVQVTTKSLYSTAMYTVGYKTALQSDYESELSSRPTEDIAIGRPSTEMNWKERTIQLPAYIAKEFESPGDYTIFISIQNDKLFANKKYIIE